MRTTTTTLLIGAFFMPVACEPASSSFHAEVEWESEHLRVSVDEGLAFCGASPAHMDAFLVRAAEALGVSLAGQQFTY